VEETTYNDDNCEKDMTVAEYFIKRLTNRREGRQYEGNEGRRSLRTCAISNIKLKKKELQTVKPAIRGTGDRIVPPAWYGTSAITAWMMPTRNTTLPNHL
jgi:hypothetical protein